MAIDVKALEAAQKDLQKRSGGGSKNWIQLSKIEAPIDIRIADPLPSMNGVYFQEVPVYWINGTRVISSRIFGPQEKDVMKNALDEARKSKDPDILALLNAKGDNGIPKIQERVEFWVPVLKFSWELDKQGNIKGINDGNGNPSTVLIKDYIDDYHWKILVTGISALKAINAIATSRGGAKMTECVEGFNLTLSKTGEKKQTKYSAVKADILPMPADLYTPEKLVDPFEVAQSLLYTDEYQDQIIGKYLYNEACPEKTDDCYAYPEIREKFKALLTDEEPEEKATPRQRPGRAATPVAEPTPPPTAPAAETPHVPTRGSASSAPARTRAGAHTAAPTRGLAAAAPAGRPARSGRNLAEDLAAVD